MYDVRFMIYDLRMKNPLRSSVISHLSFVICHLLLKHRPLKKWVSKKGKK